MQTATSYLDRVLPAIDLVADRFVTLVTQAPDPTVRVANTPDWAVRDVAAHLATVVVRYAEGPKGRGTWTSTPLDLPALNHDQVAALGIVTMGDLAASLRRELAALQAQIRGYGSRLPSFRFHGGERVRADVALGLLLGELVVHGHDVARALRRPWPIDPGHAALIIGASTRSCPAGSGPSASGASPPASSSASAARPPTCGCSATATYRRTRPTPA